MIIEDPNKEEELDKISDVDEYCDPIYKIDSEDFPEASTKKLSEVGELSKADESEFKDTPQDLKDETSQE